MAKHIWLWAVCVTIFGTAGLLAADPNLAELQQQVRLAAVKKVAPCVVTIETSGGTEVIPAKPTNPRQPPAAGGGLTKGIGPTTGLIVDPAGFIITSSFNFANKPQKIFVGVPGHTETYLAEVHATDHTRMLTLLKINANNLPVPAPAPKAEIAIGQTAYGLGRTLNPNRETSPSVTEGIISALNRIWGKALQCDAKVSPANYGGPLVDIRGRVFGVLVPLSPLSDDETAGVEWYDSGIGFAVPLEDINKVLPRLKNKQDLRRGMLGITPQNRDIYTAQPAIGTVTPESAAEKAGIKAGDLILEIDGQPIARHAQLMHALGGKYDGDVITVKVRHSDGKEETIKDIRLAATLQSIAQAWLGILPMRDDPELGVEIRYVFEKSPAAEAGLKPGDRIVKFGINKTMVDFTGTVGGREQLQAFLNGQRPGTEIKLDVKAKGGDKAESKTVRLMEYSTELPDTKEALPEGSLKKALAPKKKAGSAPKPEPKPEPKPDEKKEEVEVQDGFFKRANASNDHEYFVYVPDAKQYDPNISYAMVVWLHPSGKGKEKDIKDIQRYWEDVCDRQRMIFVCPKAENETGWLASEADFVREVITAVSTQYTIDKRRIILHGMGRGGEMAFYLSMQHLRDQVRGIATSGAALASQLKPQVPNQTLSFFVATGDKDPVAPTVKDTKTKLEGEKYPVLYREIKNLGHQYLSDDLAFDAWRDLIRWIDTLDRL